jgi:hypothetical protein
LADSLSKNGCKYALFGMSFHPIDFKPRMDKIYTYLELLQVFNGKNGMEFHSTKECIMGDGFHSKGMYEFQMGEGRIFMCFFWH